MKTIPILMYHQVDVVPPSGTPLRNLTVSPASFDWQMRCLKAWGFHGLSMRDLEPYLRGELNARVVGITFDDGYVNTHENALPILMKYGFTATCYAVSHQIGGHNFWDVPAGMAQKPLMDVPAWRHWAQLGMDVGSHTCDHIDLNQADEPVAKQQIEQSKTELEQMLGLPVRHFCYPYGRFLPQHWEWVAQAGYASATTTQRGRVHTSPEMNAYALPRVLVNHRTTWAHLGMKLLTAYEDNR
jgi:peptidoglycan/xylan/chitin deacetylase (PgdA/CDA1 family)